GDEPRPTVARRGGAVGPGETAVDAARHRPACLRGVGLRPARHPDGGALDQRADIAGPDPLLAAGRDLLRGGPDRARDPVVPGRPAFQGGGGPAAADPARVGRAPGPAAAETRLDPLHGPAAVPAPPRPDARLRSLQCSRLLPAVARPGPD